MFDPKAACWALSSCPGEIRGHGGCRVSSSPERLTGHPPSGPCDCPLGSRGRQLCSKQSLPQEPERASAPVPDELVRQHVLRMQ